MKEWDATKTWVELHTAMNTKSTKCASCIFGNENDLSWRAIVMAADGSGDGWFNWGACAARASGSAECGRAFQNDEICLDVVCADCADASTTQTCIDNAKVGTCATDYQAAHTSCNGAFDNIANTQCAYIEDVVRSLCGG